MAEIEHFVDPDQTEHEGFNSVASLRIPLYTKDAQMSGGHIKAITLQEALDQKIIDNETLGYFIGRIYLFAIKIGLDSGRLRFRQHMDNEMAHYANDCWDLECKTSYGWVECVGCAHRGCYDLTCHAKASKTPLVAERQLKVPIEKMVTTATPDKKTIAKQFKKDTGAIIGALGQLSEDEISQLAAEMNEKKEIQVAGFTLVEGQVKFASKLQKLHTISYTPSVIEPSFGIGRLLYTLLEHTYSTRENDAERRYFTIPPSVAPYKCSILPISNKPDFEPSIREITKQLKEKSLPHKVDKSAGSIGKRYARTDEIAIPYGITVDFHTVKIEPATVTLRDRDSTGQLRIELDQIADVIDQLTKGKTTWADISSKYEQQDAWVEAHPLE